MFSPSKGNRRSTRVGRFKRGSGGRTSRGSDEGAPSWQPSDKEARKWIQVMRPPAPNARFCIPTWVPIDELTPEEKNNYGPPPEEEILAPTNETVMDAKKTVVDTTVDQRCPEETDETVIESVAAASESLDAEMAAVDDAKVADNVEKTMETSATTGTAIEGAVASETTNAEMATVNIQETRLSQQPYDTTTNALFSTMATRMASVDTTQDKSSDYPDYSAKIAETSASVTKTSIIKSTPLSPLTMASRETSEGIPPSPIVDSKALESIGPLEEHRPHDPVAEILEEPGTVPPSRPVSEPAVMLMRGPAAPLIGDSILSPVPVAVHPTDVAAAAPLAASDDSDHLFVHSESDNTPFHTIAETASNEEKVIENAHPMAEEAASDEHEVLEPDSKRQRID